MSKTIAAAFETRRDAEMTVEHLVQEYGLDARSISIVAAEGGNSAGTKVAGSDNESGHDKAGTTPHPALNGLVQVSVEAEDAIADKVRAAFATYGGKPAA